MEKCFEKQIKTIADQWKKKVDALKYLKTNTKILRIKDGISKNILIGKAKNKLNKTKKIDKMVVRGELICRAN